jgi:predicted Zn-dependent protease
MKRLIFQLVVLVGIFIIGWLSFSQFNWRKLLKVEIIKSESKHKIGDLVWESVSNMETEITETSSKTCIDSLVEKICVSNHIEPSTIKVHILQKNEENAFALPDDHLVIYSQLITYCESEEELAGVLAHEIAHMQLNHVMKKLGKEIGLSVILASTTGNNPIIIQKIARLLSSTAYDRKLETEADVKGVEYLINAQINPRGLATFLMKLAKNEKNILSEIDVISTHPDSKSRASKILEITSKKKIQYQSVLHNASWKKLQDTIAEIE